MAFVTAKTILNTINLLDEEEVKEKKRHPKNEFQAFAYKLSKDLDDPDNLKIYMRLAKTVERSLMERAYSYAIDSNSEQKGRLFLWKLKQLRADIQVERDKKNFTYEFVMKKMAKFREELAEQTIHKSVNWQSKEYYLEIESFIKNSAKKKVVILSIGPNPEELFNFKSLKLSSIEISKKIAKFLKERKLKEKIICKDFFKNTYIDGCFDIIMVNSYWQFIPLESELKFLTSIQKVMDNSGRIIINLKESLEDSQCWKGMVVKDQEKEYFLKNETNRTFRTVVEKCGLEIEKELMAGGYIVYILKRHNS